MCVAVVVPPNIVVDDDTLTKMHRSNRDSWGLAFYEPHKTAPPEGSPPGYIAITKDISNTEDMLAKYKQQLTIGERAKYPHLIHFRIRTAGLTNVPNAHPFYIKHGALIHNGHLGGHHGGDYSDTFYWAKMFGDELPKDMTEEQKAFLGRLVGKYNKLAMLFNDGTTCIINENEGSRLDNGVWVSNKSWDWNRSGSYSYER